MHTALQTKEEDAFFKRLDYLFKVIENPGAFPPEFYLKCAREVEKIMILPEDSPVEEDIPNKD